MPELLERLQHALAERYRPERELGRGGFATVFLATDLKHQREVALKVLHPELALALGSARFLREIATAAQFKHPHILPLHDSGEADGLLYYVMPFVEGESLRQRLEREPQLPLEDALRITREVADALHYAHGLGVVHRDVKPENILFEAGHAIVTDFGIARAVSTVGSAKLTETGLAVGTPAYMSPEQAAGDPALDGRSDIYSLACVLYEMLAGTPPFSGPTAQAVLAAQIADPVPLLRTRRPTVPPGLERALERALAKDADQRYATAEEFAQQLTRASTADAVAAEARRERARRRRRAVCLAAVVVLLGVAGWWAVGAVQRATGHATIRRLAVLPLTSFSNDTSQEYFVEGVHDALISNLQEAGVTVLGRTSVLRYRGTEKPPRQIARELGVDALIEASLMRSSDSMEITVRLIDGRTAALRWQHSYPGEVRSVLALYHGITRAIAEQIQSTLSPAAAARLATARTLDPQAYDDYLQGMFYWRRFTPGDFQTALEYFHRALRRDSTFALAWAGIALTWRARDEMAMASPQEAIPRVRAALQKALALDSNCAEAWMATASFRACNEWDWAGSERAIRRAIEINPNSADMRAWYADGLTGQGRFGEAHAQIERGLEIDSLNPLLRLFRGLGLYREHRYAEAERELRRTLEIEPNQLAARANLFGPLWHLGRYDEALAILRQSLAGDQEAQSAIAQGFAEGGYRGVMRHLATVYSARPWQEYATADAFALAGETDSALVWLERAYRARSSALVYLSLEPDFDRMRSDPRFQDLCRRMHFFPTCAPGGASAPATARQGM